MTVSIQRVANAYLLRQGAKALGGKAARLVREAAAGAKPLIDAEPLVEVLTALGWEVTPSVEGKVVEGRAAFEAKENVVAGLKQAVPGWVTLRLDVVEPDNWTVDYAGTRGVARFTVVAQEKTTLGKLRKALEKLQRKVRPGELNVTIREDRLHRGRGTAIWQQKPAFGVFVRINVRVWSFKNPQAKGAARKPVSLTQKYNANLKLEPATGMKAGQLWNSLYARGLQGDAQYYLREHGESLPSPEELETPEEKIKRRFDQEVKAKLLSFTDKQFKAVVADYEDYYTKSLTRFLADQEAAFKRYSAEAEKDRAEGRRPKGSMRGTRRDPSRWDQGLPHIMPFLEWDDARSDRHYPLVEVYKSKGTWKQDIKKEAEKVTREIRDGFVRKNTMKLSAIVTGKGNLKSIEVLGWARSNFEGDMRFAFKDGSSFEVRNKTVTKMSSRGRWFSQYPTTFHQVIMPDGKKMPSPSEKRMIDVFAAV